MKTFKGYVKENFKELVKISCAVDPKNSAKFEALLKKMVFGYNGPMIKSRYDALGLDEFIIVGPSTPVMKWVSKYKAMIVKLAKLPMPKITFASVDVNQYDGENLFEAKLTATKDFYKTAMSKKQKDEFDKLYKKLEGGKEHQNIKRKIKNPVKADDHFHALVMKRIIGDKRSSFDSKEAFGEAIDHPAFINVTLQDFAKHMKRIKPHAKKAGTKLTVQGKDVKVDGLATAIKKMFDYMTSDGKGFYE